ncbi:MULTISPECIES: twin-arginine translocase TatA/TatE family subunit [unclassified Agromyces]|uniref:twin-arginine translocase TatA/TatE family subunit n=1 Tax=unclassified Agromyces TaxID=2639701 RepID=UPI003014ACB4
MFGNAFTGWHALIILLVILLLFGAPKLPALARSLGQSMKILKNEVRPDADGERTDAADGTTAADAPVTGTSTASNASTATPPASSTSADPAKRTDAGPTA